MTAAFCEEANIAASGKRTVTFKPFCGLFRQKKWLPLQYMQNLQLALEVVSTGSDAVISNNAATVFTATTTSTS